MTASAWLNASFQNFRPFLHALHPDAENAYRRIAQFQVKDEPQDYHIPAFETMISLTQSAQAIGRLDIDDIADRFAYQFTPENYRALLMMLIREDRLQAYLEAHPALGVAEMEQEIHDNVSNHGFHLRTRKGPVERSEILKKDGLVTKRFHEAHARAWPGVVDKEGKIIHTLPALDYSELHQRYAEGYDELWKKNFLLPIWLVVANEEQLMAGISKDLIAAVVWGHLARYSDMSFPFLKQAGELLSQKAAEPVGLALWRRQTRANVSAYMAGLPAKLDQLKKGAVVYPAEPQEEWPPKPPPEWVERTKSEFTTDLGL